MNTDALVGTVLDGRYRIDARLARGGMASVYRALDTRLERSVAVKVIHSHLAEQPDFVERFIREARSAARLSNPHVVSVFDQGVATTPAGDLPYLVMEYIDGSDVRTQLSRHGSLPVGIALEITRQTLVALAAAHDNDIVHRDVKPENILLEGELDTTAIMSRPTIRARVADFGLARAASAATHTSTMLGTVAYISPELVSDGIAGPQADIYSVGIMLYELISGSLPFTGQSPVSVAYKHVNEPMPRLGDAAEWMPPAIDSLIALFTAKNPAKRPANGAAALAALEDVSASISDDVAIKRIPVFASTAQPHSTRIMDEEPRQTMALNHVPTEKHPAENPAANHHAKVDDQPRRRRWKPVAIILLLVASLAGIGYGAYWFFTAGPGQRVTIPDVTAMTLDDAVATLEADGLTADITREFSDTVPLDSVIETDPGAGERIHPDTPVELVVSDGIEQVEVPDLAGLSADAASAAVIDARLTPIADEAYSETVPEGEVIEQSPVAGEMIDHSSEVTYVVSLGREPLDVPDLEGSSLADAQRAIEDSGLIIAVTEEYSDDVAEGVVISQDPASATTLYRGDEVRVVVSLGPELVAVPNVVGMQESQAVEAIRAAGFEVEVEYVLGGYFGTVRMQDPGADAMMRPGTVIKLTVV